MRRLMLTWWLLLGLSVVLTLAEAPGENAARKAVGRFGQAMIAGDATLLTPILPEQGKIKLKLERLGPEDGSFSSNQVVALLAGFLDAGRVEAFTVTRIEHDPHGVALASVRLALMDKQSRSASVTLHLTCQTEDDRWVVREIRETPQ